MAISYRILLTQALLLLGSLGGFCDADHKRSSVSPYDEPGYGIYEHVLSELQSMAHSVVDMYSSVLDRKYPGGGEALRDSMLPLLDSGVGGVEEGVRPENTTCNVCRALLSTLIALVRNGTDYEDIKNVTMDICYLVVPAEGWNPDTLCDLVIDTYAPHVIYVLNTTDHDAVYLCQYYNKCQGDIPPPDRAPRFLPTDQPKPKQEVRHESGFSNPIRVLHFTDAHIDHKYDVGAPLYCDMPLCCRAEYNGTGAGKYWGDYQCNIPPYTADHFFAYILRRFSPDLILYTGDTFQHTVWDQPLSETIAADKWLADNIWHFFPGIPAYSALGNHDVTPTNLYYARRPEIQDINRETFNHWRQLSKFTDAQRETIEKSIYFTASPFPGLRILSYNSEYGALDNFYSVLLYDEPEYVEMMQFMNDTLAAAEASGEKVIMLGHRPTGGGNKTPGYNRFMNDLQSRYGDTVILHLLGHNHDDKFALVRDFTTGETRGVQISSPSMTSYTNTNPSVRMFYLDPQTYQPLDMETYRIDIAADGDSPNPQLKLTYSMTGDYGMPDATAASFDLLTARLAVDDALFDEFMYNVETATGFNGPCSGGCRERMICDLRNADAVMRSECRSNLPL